MINVEEKVYEIITKDLCHAGIDVDDEKIRKLNSLEKLGVDSTTRLDIIIDLEEHFRLWVSEDKMKSFDNIDDIVEYFDKADLI